MFRGAIEQFLDKPMTFLAGLGPDVTVRMAESGHPLIDSLLTNPDSGITEGALDSTYVTVFLEYGILLGLWMLLFCGMTLSLLYREMMKRGASVFPSLLIAIFLWWMIVASTQRVGTSKPTWLIVQMIAMAYSSKKLAVSADQHIPLFCGLKLGNHLGRTAGGDGPMGSEDSRASE
jgi:hypothetical protein